MTIYYRSPPFLIAPIVSSPPADSQMAHDEFGIDIDDEVFMG